MIGVTVNIYFFFYVNQLLFCNWINTGILLSYNNIVVIRAVCLFTKYAFIYAFVSNLTILILQEKGGFKTVRTLWKLRIVVKSSYIIGNHEFWSGSAVDKNFYLWWTFEKMRAFLLFTKKHLWPHGCSSTTFTAMWSSVRIQKLKYKLKTLKCKLFIYMKSSL